MIAILILAVVVAVLWSGYKYQTAYVALIDALPSQFQDGLNSKFAFPEYVLKPSTPLATQANYIESQVGSCIAALGIALLCFLYGNAVAGAIVLAMFVGFSILTIKSWKIYRANCSRGLTRDEAH